MRLSLPRICVFSPCDLHLSNVFCILPVIAAGTRPFQTFKEQREARSAGFKLNERLFRIENDPSFAIAGDNPEGDYNI